MRILTRVLVCLRFRIIAMFPLILKEWSGMPMKGFCVWMFYDVVHFVYL